MRGTPFASDPRGWRLAMIFKRDSLARQGRHLMGDDRNRQESAPMQTKDGPAPPAPVVHRSADILQGRNEALIEHEGVIYRLRLTSAGKLYMTK
jgi:hemin uptake protein HemP